MDSLNDQIKQVDEKIRQLHEEIGEAEHKIQQAVKLKERLSAEKCADYQPGTVVRLRDRSYGRNEQSIGIVVAISEGKQKRHLVAWIATPTNGEAAIPKEARDPTREVSYVVRYDDTTVHTLTDDELDKTIHIPIVRTYDPVDLAASTTIIPRLTALLLPQATDLSAVHRHIARRVSSDDIAGNIRGRGVVPELTGVYLRAGDSLDAVYRLEPAMRM